MALSYFNEFVGGVDQLWVTDGTALGTHLVASFGASAIQNLTTIGARVFFGLSDGTHGEELWTSDGTAAGTMMVKDIFPGSTSSFPAFLTSASGALYFEANDGSHGAELWKSNGTAAGTVMVADIFAGSGGSFPFLLTNVDGVVYFAANDGAHNTELWKSDGTAAGTVIVRDINPGSGTSNPGNLTRVNGALYFEASDGAHGAELWKSDGTAAGTVMVKDIAAGASDSFPQGLANVDGTLYFEANDGVDGFELWKSDGTAAGTVMVKDINPGASGSTPSNLTNVDGALFFTANDGAHGFELWKSDGTAAGTVMVRDINPGAPDSSPSFLTNVNGELYFAANDGADGDELWKSDGTAAGTLMVKDIIFGAGGSFPVDLAAVNGAVEFYAFDGAGTGLFRSDGTAGGTIEIATNVQNTTNLGVTARPNRDFNGDSFSDILWQNASGQAAIWELNGTSQIAGGSAVVGANPGPSWKTVGTGDFNGDSLSDILWQNANGQVAVWEMNGTSVIGSGSAVLAANPGPNWKAVGTGDFNGDSLSDILWQNANGQVAVWEMNGTSVIGSGSAVLAANPGPNWKAVGTGDFNGDGHSDILFQNTNGQVAIWEMNGTSQVAGGSAVLAANPGPSWKAIGTGDFNGDGHSDILFQSTNGQIAIWEMNGLTQFAGGSAVLAANPGPTWKAVGTGDFNGDGHSDILFQNTNGQAAIWDMNGLTQIAGGASLVGPNPGAAWRAIGV